MPHNIAPLFRPSHSLFCGTNPFGCHICIQPFVATSLRRSVASAKRTSTRAICPPPVRPQRPSPCSRFVLSAKRTQSLAPPVHTSLPQSCAHPTSSFLLSHPLFGRRSVAPAEQTHRSFRPQPTTSRRARACDLPLPLSRSPLRNEPIFIRPPRPPSEDPYLPPLSAIRNLPPSPLRRFCGTNFKLGNLPSPSRFHHRLIILWTTHN